MEGKNSDDHLVSSLASHKPEDPTGDSRGKI